MIPKRFRGLAVTPPAARVDNPGVVVEAAETYYESLGRVEKTVDRFGTATLYFYDAAGDN